MDDRVDTHEGAFETIEEAKAKVDELWKTSKYWDNYNNNSEQLKNSYIWFC